MKHKKLLLGLVLLLGIGFATVSTILYTSGNVKIATNNTDFDVIFTKAILDETDISETAISSDGKIITFGTNNLSAVGDISKLDFEVTNNSEMYDAEVSINCTANGTNKDHYEIIKEVASPIKGKRTGAGKVEVKLLKASVEDFSEEFTCTLGATATERITKAKEKYVPKYFAYGDPTTASTTDYTTLTYITGNSANGQPAEIFIGLDADGVQKSVCTLATGSLECFKNNNTVEELEHAKQVFGEGNCSGNSTGGGCGLGSFSCSFGSNGLVGCIGSGVSCNVRPDDSATCAY